jgi:hypothetical protein
MDNFWSAIETFKRLRCVTLYLLAVAQDFKAKIGLEEGICLTYQDFLNDKATLKS